MSWFRHVPPKHPPLPKHTPPHHSSPVAERMLEETKQRVRTPKPKSNQ